MLQAATAILCALTLAGCSYSYEVEARVSGGRLIFEANPQWGTDCVRRVEVRAEEDTRSGGAGTVWKQSIPTDDACENRFPVVYGEPLRGRPPVYDSGGVPDALAGVAAKKLLPGVIYTVSTTTGATGFGCGRFRIRPDRQVQNLGCS